MKKFVLYLGLFFPIFGILFPATNEEPFSLPIRVIENTQESEELNRNDIKLLINGIPRQVTHLNKQQRSLSLDPDLGRHIILSFHNIKYTKPIENAISYFFTEILNPKDFLVLLSPVKAYRIPVTRNKEKMIMDVMNFLDKDCAVHEKNRISAEKKLEAELQRLNTITSNQPNDFFAEEPENSEQVLAQATNLATNYKAIYRVLLNFPQNFTRFKNQYLLPDIVKHLKIKNLLKKKHGEKWWVHFQHREDIQIIHKARSAGRKLNAYITTHETGTLARTMHKSLADLEKQLLIAESISNAEILDTLLGNNICYNIVYWGSIKTNESNTSFKETSDLEAALRRIAESSGGKTTVVTDPEKGIMEITQHSDYYFDLVFDFNGKIEEKNIQISAENRNFKFSHKQKFSKEEVDEWTRTLTEEKVKIRDFSLLKNTLHFGIESFTQNQENQFGMLKVRISLFDLKNTNVYKSENTLRASKDRIVISVPLPPEYQGEFRLCIEVFDLLANTSASSEHLIEIN
jgi:hypothetical protein